MKWPHSQRVALLAAGLLGLIVATACGARQGSSNGSPRDPPQPPPAEETTTMKIRLTFDGRAHTATLTDTAAARDFASLLPLELTLEDYHATEKIADLPRKLTIADAPEGHDPAVGDITYYAPWGNLAIFYRDFGYSRGLVHLGTLEGAAEALQAPGRVAARIERLE